MKLPKGFNTIKYDFYPYQYESFLFAIERPTAGLLLDMGLGKTRVAIDVARYHMQFNGVKKVLVVCPTSVMYHWEEEIETYSEYESTVLYGPKDERLYRLGLDEPRFFVINYEYLHPLLEHLEVLKKVKRDAKEYTEAEKLLLHHKYRGTLTREMEERLRVIMKYHKNKTVTERLVAIDAKRKIARLGFDMCIFDESARYLKNHLTDRTRASEHLARMADYKLILTATPIANRPMDLFGQFLVLDGGRTFTKNFWRFRNGFFKNIGRGRMKKWVLRSDKVDIMRKRLYSSCIRFKKTDVPNDLPPIVEQTIRPPAPSSYYDQYRALEKQVITDIETEQGGSAIVNITNVLTKLIRLQQFTSGFAKDRISGEEKKIAVTPKLDALIEQVELIMDAEESVIIWCRFHMTMRMITEALQKKKILSIGMSGHDKAKQKRAKWKGFQESKATNVFVGQIESGGIGIQLFKEDSERDKTQHMIFYENVWSLDVRRQAEGRIHRIGQNSTCRYLDLVMSGTIDERILKTLQHNQEVADWVLDRGVTKFLKGE